MRGGGRGGVTQFHPGTKEATASCIDAKILDGWEGTGGPQQEGGNVCEGGEGDGDLVQSAQAELPKLGLGNGVRKNGARNQCKTGWGFPKGGFVREGGVVRAPVAIINFTFFVQDLLESYN